MQRRVVSGRLRLTGASVWHTIRPRLGRQPGNRENPFDTYAPIRAKTQKSEWPRMAEPFPLDSVQGRDRAGRWKRAVARFASLALVLEVALGLRVLAADAVEWYVRSKGADRLCLFDDTRIYWELARKIRVGAPYEVVYYADIPHFALRTPGYPLLIAACQALFGERPLAVRLVQAVLGTVGVYLAYRLTSQFLAPSEPAEPRRWTIPLIAAAIAALNPYYSFLSAILLSEAVFVPLMLAVLWGQAVLWHEPGRPNQVAGWKEWLVALGSGAAAGAAILVRPSWALFVPAMLAIRIIASLRDRGALIASIRGAFLCAVGAVVVMGPWWVRNASIYDRFVPTALWMGASLYDGVNPNATGASDMTFLRDPEIWPMDEQDQDAELTRRAFAFARAEPMRVISLAWSKLGRYWTPWPNADVLQNPAVVVAATIVELPVLAIITVGAWARRRDLRAWVLLAGPLLYFCALHVVFASSMRYRIPGEIPALGLAAIGWTRLATFIDVLKSNGISPRSGRHKTARGNAPGTGGPFTSEP
jgi:Dolichyl-phosphate-mannose-protein mannosyltransferase